MSNEVWKYHGQESHALTVVSRLSKLMGIFMSYFPTVLRKIDRGSKKINTQNKKII